MNVYILSAILAMAAATVVSRAAPFLFLGRWATRPAVRFLGKATPPVILTLLVLYCLKGVSPTVSPYGLPEAVALSLTVGLHLAWRNALVSIGAGTGAYMALVQSGVISGLI
jgi:branched-subunit amino acid transport protein AzlD